MNTSALILMITTMLVVTLITAYFFYKVLTIPPRSEPDSYSENDDVER
ncbi:MAG: hypothetical protein LC117_03910 [Bacteroidia bacterium]|nr:hypothetical protein [Bacteroidia bacterium]MCZ2277054.1 hypothetical protein [Bacteroidia bacterium]